MAGARPSLRAILRDVHGSAFVQGADLVRKRQNFIFELEDSRLPDQLP